MGSISGIIVLAISFVIHCQAVYHEGNSPTLSVPSQQGKQKYVVYMGANTEGMEAQALVSSHYHMLAQVLGSEEEASVAMGHTYKHVFSGFSAWLTEDQAQTFSNNPDVLKVFPNRMRKPLTTHSWDFIGVSPTTLQSLPVASQDIIVGVLDTGIWPESKSFSDWWMSPVPAKWKGTCDNNGVTNASTIITCNKKLIGVRNYVEDGFGNARDVEGHGTHTSSTIGGRPVSSANEFGLANGTAVGGLPSARLAMYRVCGSNGCPEDAILAAFDDAMDDGVDVLSLSLGGRPKPYDLDVIAIASFHAMEKGIVVSCAAGNEGPRSKSVSNAAPWILTVGASSIDRKFDVDIHLGNGKTVQGSSINLDEIWSPLIYGANAALPSADPRLASFCEPKSLDPTKVKGKIVICTYDSIDRHTISTALQNMSANGLILGSDIVTTILTRFTLPGAAVTLSTLQDILSYVNSTSNPTATIYPTKTVLNTTRAPAVAFFSSRGPNVVGSDIIKPDIIAPGLNILAAWSGAAPIFEDGKNTIYGDFMIISGTSMACPHATAAAAYVKSVHPDWSPAAIKSALMTTAKYLDNTNQPIQDFDGSVATPFVIGSGQITPLKAANPGLVYDATPDDYITYLCESGYTPTRIKVITGRDVNCQSGSLTTLNYPSVTIGIGITTVTRTVTNVGAANSMYKATVEVPNNLLVKVSPEVLQFNSTGQKLQFRVELLRLPLVGNWTFGWLTWSSDAATVTSPLVIRLIN